jgi:hypothetical protein
MIEADSHLKQLPASILDIIYTVFEHRYAVHRHRVAALYVIPTLLGSDCGVCCGNFWSQNDVFMSWLRLTATSNCFPLPYETYTK